MRTKQTLCDALLTATVWGCLALGGLAMQDHAGAALLLWAPAGITVAALYKTRIRQWPLLVAVLLPLQMLALRFAGISPLQAAIDTGAGLVQAAIATLLALQVLGGRNRPSAKFSQALGLFGAAFFGCLVGAVVAAPSHDDWSLGDHAWWFFANAIGILAITPLVTHVRQVMASGAQVLEKEVDPGFILAMGCFAGITWGIIRLEMQALMPLTIAAAVCITFRYGNRASALAVLIFAIVAEAASIASGGPTTVFPGEASESRLAMQLWLCAMLATALPIAAMLRRRDELEAELVRQNRELEESNRLLDLAKSLAGIGRWRLDIASDTQEWSPQMLELLGLPASLGPDPGDMRHLMPDGGEFLFERLAMHRDEREPYGFEIKVKPLHSNERVLRISLVNEFDTAGKRLAVFAIAMDVTEQVNHALALEVARKRAMRLAAQAQKLASTDPLTGLPNRRATFERLETLVQSAQEDGVSLTAIMFDIDHFKAINDTHGHLIGDQVIKQVGELSRRQTRADDHVGRIGGEEFVWLLPGLDTGDARKLGERLRQAVEQGIEGSLLPDVTISVGVAHFRADDDGDALLARADTALYSAKRGGRNRVRKAA